jgi:hypothetical protein
MELDAPLRDEHPGYNLHIANARVLPDPQKLWSREWLMHQLYTINWTNMALILTVVGVSWHINGQLGEQNRILKNTQEASDGLKALIKEAEEQHLWMAPAMLQLDQFNATLSWAVENGLPQLQHFDAELQSLTATTNSLLIPPTVAQENAATAWAFLIGRCAMTTGGSNDNSYYVTWNGLDPHGSAGALMGSCSGPSGMCHRALPNSGCSTAATVTCQAGTVIGRNGMWHDYSADCDSTSVNPSYQLGRVCCCQTTVPTNGCVTAAVAQQP